MTLGTLQKALIEGVVEDPALARKIASAGRVYSGIAAADTNATKAHVRLDDPALLGKYQLDLGVQSVVGALALANLPAIPQEKLNAITDPSKLVSATLGVLQNATANQAGYAGFQSAVGANLLAAWTVVAGRAIIANATIQDAHVASLSANKFTGGTISTGTINVDSSLTIAANGSLIVTGALAIDSTGLNLVGRSTDVEMPNVGTAAKITPAGATASTQYGAFNFYANPTNNVRGIHQVGVGVANGLEGLVRLSAVANLTAGFGDTQSAALIIQSNKSGRGFVEMRSTDLLITAGGNLSLGSGRIITTYELPSTSFSPTPSGGSAFSRAHGLGRVPWHCEVQYSGASQAAWRDGTGISQGADVSFNFDGTNIYFYNNRTENVNVRIQAW